MDGIPYKGYRGTRLPKDVQWKRVQLVIREELTEIERQTLLTYYLEKRTIEEIAGAFGVNKSTVCRNLKRAERRVRRFLRY